MASVGCSTDADCGPGFICVGDRCIPDPGDGGPTGGPGLPGLGQYVRNRYTANGAITDEMSANDFLHDVLFVTSRMFMTQNEKGQISLKNKKPVPYAFATAAVSGGGTSIPVDNVQDWIGNTNNLLLLSPNTTQSEVALTSGAAYSSSQNSITLTQTGGLVSIAGFSGCNGANTPATASITVTGLGTPPVSCTITLEGTQFDFKTTSGDTTQSIASYIAGIIKTHPAFFRRFSVSWTEGTSVVNLTARFGTITVSNGLLSALPTPLANPTTAPTLSASGSGSALTAGPYIIAVSAVNANGETLLSHYKTVTLTAGQQINVSSYALPSGATGLKWYMSPQANSQYLRYFKTQLFAAAFTITASPRLTAPLPPDLNRTGAEVMRISAAFSDRSFARTRLTRSNVIKASFKWFLGERNDSVNQIKFKYRDAAQDYRLVELRMRDDAHIAKTKKIKAEEINGQFVDNSDQANRLAAGYLAEKRTADYFQSWEATREALLLQEGDVVAITDNGSGVVNLPMIIEDIEYQIPTVSLPSAVFTGRLYASTLYDDSVVEHEILIIAEN
jgi:hypothetical protein